MSEYEIFDDESEYVSQNNSQKPRRIKKQSNFFKSLFSLENISIVFSIVSLIMSFFVAFIPYVASSADAVSAVASMFFFAFAFAITGLVFEILKHFKKTQFVFGIHILLVIISLIVSFFALPF